jgi:hypothetical protein
MIIPCLDQPGTACVRHGDYVLFSLQPPPNTVYPRQLRALRSEKPDLAGAEGLGFKNPVTHVVTFEGEVVELGDDGHIINVIAFPDVNPGYVNIWNGNGARCVPFYGFAAALDEIWQWRRPIIEHPPLSPDP